MPDVESPELCVGIDIGYGQRGFARRRREVTTVERGLTSTSVRPVRHCWKVRLR